MAQIKLMWIIIDWIGIPVSVLGFIVNFGNVKSAILFIVGLIYMGIRVYYYVIEREQRKRDKELDLWNKEQDKLDRLNKVK